MNDDQRRYSTREVARLLDLPERRIRGWVRTGVVSGGRQDPCPSGRGTGAKLRFDFRDLLVLKAAGKLLAAGLTAARVEQALLALRRQLGPTRPLSALRLSVEGGQVLVSDGEVHWEPASGQARLTFPAPRPDRPAPPSPEAQALRDVLQRKRLGVGLGPGGAEQRSADEWFNLGLDLEPDDPDAAYEAYVRALAANPEHVEAMINVGRLCSEAGDDSRAAAYFRQASRVNPGHPVAHFNLAVTLHDHGDLDGALHAYQAALIHDPQFADAHYNLATLLEQLGEPTAAAEHMAAYRAVLRGPRR